MRQPIGIVFWRVQRRQHAPHETFWIVLILYIYDALFIFQPLRCLDIGAALQRTVRIDAQDESGNAVEHEAWSASIPVFHLRVQLWHHGINVERLRTGDQLWCSMKVSHHTRHGAVIIYSNKWGIDSGGDFVRSVQSMHTLLWFTLLRYRVMEK